MNVRRPKPTPSVVAIALVLTAVGTARAQEGVVTAPVFVGEAPPAPTPPAVPLDHYTAHMIGGRRLKIGVLAFDYGINDRISFGTDPPEWAIRSVTSVLVPNLHVRANFVHTAGLDITGEVAGYYANINHTDASGHVLMLPLSLFASVRLTHAFWLHLEGAYNWSRGWGAGDVSQTDVGGTVVMRTVQIGAMAELKLSRVVALIARGRYQVWETPIIFQGDGMIDPYTHVNASIEAMPPYSHPAMGVAGVALTWKHVGVVAGAGYGHYFLPGANLALPYNSVVPEGSLWALF
jgi:hypothetical protein